MTTAEQLWDLIEGLQDNGLLEYTHLVTGKLFVSNRDVTHILFRCI